ncbi:hypothetical protein JCM6882_000282 [Rhodosporidiobolus microsporus]
MPFTSAAYKADPFPIPRYSSPPSWAPETWVPKLLHPHHQDSPPLSSPSSSPPLSTAVAFPTPPGPHPNLHPHLPHSSAHPSFLHLLQTRLARSHSLLAESRAEALEAFPDASGATRTKPLLPNVGGGLGGGGDVGGLRVKVGAAFGGAGGKPVASVRGEWVATALGGQVEVWNEQEEKAGYCEITSLGIAIEEPTALCWSSDGRSLWVGTSFGALFTFDLSRLFGPPSASFSPTSSRSSSPLHVFDHLKLPRTGLRRDAHPSGSPILKIARVRSDDKGREDRIYSIDASGRVVVWLPSPNFFGKELPDLHGHSRVFHLDPHLDFPVSPRSPPFDSPIAFVEVTNGLVWASWNLHSDASGSHKQVRVKVYDVSGIGLVEKGHQHWSTSIGKDVLLGSVTSACVVPSKPKFVFFGHDSGHISVWRADGTKLIEIVKVSLSSVTALVGPSRFLWVGYSNGIIDILDLAHGDDWPCNWKVVKRFQAHHGPVVSLAVDPVPLWASSALPALRVVSVGKKVKFWDGLLHEDWLVNRMSSLVDTYCTFRPLKVGIFTWNVDGQNPGLLQSSKKAANSRLLESFLTSLDKPDLVVFNFQELVDLSDLGLAARTALFATHDHDVTGRYRHWHKVLDEAVLRFLGTAYWPVKEEKLVGMYTVVFARNELRGQIRDLATHKIKNGFDEFYGNKGSLMFRLVLDDSSLCFINAHLAAGKKHHAERERDLISILDGAAQFGKSSEPMHRAYIGGGDGTAVRDCEMVFFVGDLNFRLDLPRSEVLHTLSTAPSLESAITTLLPHDELSLLRASHPSFRLRSFEEAPILFPPTYKYEHNSDVYDQSAKQRTPSWCDRVLWRSEREESVKCVSLGRFEADISDHRPVAALFEVQVKKVNRSLEEQVFRQATLDWEHEADALLKTARSYYPRES